MASHEDFSVLKCTCVMAYQSLRLQTNLFHGFMLIKLILEARMAKIDINLLQAQLAVTKILLQVISGKTVIVIFEKR